MESGKHPVAQWLDRATAAIRFGPDRKEVRAELEAHLEDKALDYLRIFPDLTEEEARERAAAQMGDGLSYRVFCFASDCSAYLSSPDNLLCH